MNDSYYKYRIQTSFVRRKDEESDLGKVSAIEPEINVLL
jgi:hypothetical protein